MAITKSAKKAFRQSERRKKHNTLNKNKIKNLEKRIEKLLIEKKIDEAKKLLPEVYKALDKAAKRKVIKKNKASRRKSRIAKSLKRA
ncbi:30S ribosomal protein S20 [Candidatus Parcubacteria bacterium]|nr:30S ribosomal protein S20 [Patescibacteria group bacterium]MBU4466819.1 30S ribosomal protein S20 [Patescibacteria group bacterium]MCG2688122.1 30S ribosomal protein S20 [Candidatus Parcubacteria bacterium]